MKTSRIKNKQRSAQMNAQNSTLIEWLKPRAATGMAALLIGMTGAYGATPPLVTVGDPGNASDAAGYGAVGYIFRIGEREVTRSEYTEFLNAVAAADTYNLYNASMGIARTGSSGSYRYSTTDGSKPVAYVNWYDALRYANWLHNGQPTGAQGPSTTEAGAYTFSAQFTVGARNAGARYFLPNENEWFKAAYYQGGTDAFYWTYPTRSDTAPLAAPPSADDNSANFNNVVSGGVTIVSSYAQTIGYYGTHDQAGNLWEWNESANDSVNDGSRGLRGGSYNDYPMLLESWYRDGDDPKLESDFIGFRIAAARGNTQNSAPVGVADSYTVSAGSTLAVAAPGVLANDTDADGDALTAKLVTNPAHGSLTLSANGSFTYVPASGYGGADSFTYKPNDGTVDGSVATVAITVQQQTNRAPVGVADSYTVSAGSTLTVAAPGVLANDTDADGDALVTRLATSPAHGTLTLNANGSFTYVPTNGYSGTDSFAYRPFDGKAYGSSATVTITVTAVVASAFKVNQAEWRSASRELAVSGLGPVGQTVTIKRGGGASIGTCVVTSDGSWSFVKKLTSAPNRIRATCQRVTLRAYVVMR
jgi:VCBS repeat-containing protein